jgi:hypothetical protein
MKSGDLTSGSGRLHDALEVLQVRWEDTKAQWQDQVRVDFERQYLDALPSRVLSLVERINLLSQLIVKARHECSDSHD